MSFESSRLLEYCRCYSCWYKAWLLCFSHIQYYDCHAYEEQHHEEYKQTSNFRSNTRSLTLLSLFSISPHHHHYSRHDDLNQYGSPTPALSSKSFMFQNARSFDEDISSWDVSSVRSFVSGIGAIRMFMSFASSCL